MWVYWSSNDDKRNDASNTHKPVFQILTQAPEAFTLSAPHDDIMIPFCQDEEPPKVRWNANYASKSNQPVSSNGETAS